jgi:hypothetical protein
MMLDGPVVVILLKPVLIDFRVAAALLDDEHNYYHGVVGNYEYTPMWTC